MSTNWMSLVTVVTSVIAAGSRDACRGADEVVVFGLTNRSINLAGLVLESEYPELRVTDLSNLGYKGLSVRLGQAESGLFFSPYTRAPLEDDYFMIGHAYGRSAGLERRLVSVYGKRAGWATYPVTVDFLPLGTVSKTVRLFVDDMFVGEEDYTDGAVTVSSENDSSLAPRVNPFWRMPDGSVGVLLEFSGVPPIQLPSGRTAYARRVFIRANRPLFAVDYVSRVDIYGGGGLPEFSGLDERLGMFGRPHRALGDAVFTANRNRLTIGGCADAGTDGVMIELANTPSFRAGFQPVSLGRSGALFQVSATGAAGGYGSGAFHGPIGIENVDGEKHLRAGPSDGGAWSARVEVLNGDVPAGAFNVAGPGLIGSFGTNALDVVAAGVIGGGGRQFATLTIELRQAATLTAGSQVLRGNIVRLSQVNVTNDSATFGSFQVLACGVSPFTITNEFAAPPPPLALAIEPRGTNVVVSWPVTASPYSYLATADGLDPSKVWRYTSTGVLLPPLRSRARMSIPIRPSGEAYFQLLNPYLEFFINSPVPD